MYGSDSETGETNVLFPPGFIDLKPNVLSHLSFDKAVVEANMSYVHFPRYPIPDDADPETPLLVCLPREGEMTIFLLQIDARLLFPCCPDLVEMCHHYGICLSEISPNAIHTWVSFV